MGKAERAMERLYGDISLREDLTDDEAKPLFKWAEQKVMELDSTTEDEEVFDEKFKQLRRMMKRMNHFIGYRASEAPEEQRETLHKMMESASEIGIRIDETQMESFFSAQSSLSNDEALQSMLGMLGEQSGEGTPHTPASSVGEGAGKLFGALKNAANAAQSEQTNPEGETDEQEQ